MTSRLISQALALFLITTSTCAAQLQGSPAAGRATFRRTCAVCHAATPEQTIIGPSLFGVVGRHAGSLVGYSYSPAMVASGLTWTEDNIFEFISTPGLKVPGTKMTFAGLKDADQRRDVIAYLRSLGDGPH